MERRSKQLATVGAELPEAVFAGGAIQQHLGYSLPHALTLREVFGIFRRQLLWILLIIAFTLSAGIYLAATSTPVYRSTTTMLIEGSKGQEADPISNVSMNFVQRDMQTQIEVLRSSKLMGEVYELAGINEGLRVARGEELSDVLPVLQVEPVGDSSVLRVSVESSVPEYAQRVAEFVPQVYLGYLVKTRQGEIEGTKEHLEKRLAQEKVDLRLAETRLMNFKKGRPLLPLEGEATIRSGKASGAETEVKQIEATIAGIQARIDQLMREKAALPASLRTDRKSVNTALIESQKAAISELKTKREALLERYLPDNEQIVQIDIQIKGAEARLKAIPKEADNTDQTRHPDILRYDQAIADARVDLKAAEVQRAKLAQYATKAEDELISYSADAPQQEQLAQAVVDRKETIKRITESLEDINVRKSSVRDPVVVLTPPSTPGKVRPRPTQTVLLALLFGGFLAIGFALLKDGLDDKMATADEVPRLTGLPLLGELLPLPNRIRTLEAGGLNARFLERYRVLRFNLGLILSGSPAKSIVVTSSGRVEGRTEFACNFALASAEGEDRRVILVDADFRKPSVHKRFGLGEKPGLSDVLLDQARLEEALQPGPVPGLQILASGGAITNPVDLLATPQMLELVARLEGLCDLLVFDLPTATGLADAHVLSRIVDSVILVAKVGRTRRNLLRKVVEAFRQAEVRMLGVAAIAEKFGRR